MQTNTQSTKTELRTGAITPAITISAPKKSAASERSIADYAEMLRKRWKLIAAIASGLFLAIALFIFLLPVTYRADVLVILQAPSVSTQNSVVVQPDIRQKLDALREQVESRRTLAGVVKKFDLYAASQGVIPQDEIFEMMRKSITLKVGKSSFNLCFDHSNPQCAADVANELARQYIEENTKLRRDSLNNTSNFINSNVQKFDREVKDIEGTLQEFRKQNLGGMPEDVPANQALLQTLQNQVSASETSLEGELLRKRQIEERITEMCLNDLKEKQRQIAAIGNVLRRFPRLEDGPPEPVSAALPVAYEQRAGGPNADSDIKRLKEKLQDIDQALAKAKSTTRSDGLPNTDIAELRKQRTQIEEEISRKSAAAARSAQEAADDRTPVAAVSPEEIELEMLRENLRMKENAVRDSSRNTADLEGMHARGLISTIVLEKARSDVERAQGELRIQRTRAFQHKTRLENQLKEANEELAGLKEFQAYWSEMLVKLQELEAQRLRITSTSSEEQIRNATDRIEKMTVEMIEMRKTQSGLRTMSSRGELATRVQEHENIMAHVTRVQSDIQSMRTRMADLDRKLTNSARVQIQYPELMRKYRTVTDQYEGMLRQKMQTDIALSVDEQQNGERMILWDPAIPSSSPYRPKYAMLFSGGLLAALAAALGTALLLELVSAKYLNAETLSTQTGLNVVTNISDLPKTEVPEPPKDMPAEAGKIITLWNPHHRVSKQFLDGACLLFKPQAVMPRVVAVCSPGPGDGKTFVAANLAVALALSKREPALLIDANLRAPALHNIFGKPLERGLADALESKPMNVHPIPIPGNAELQLITAGQVQRHGTILLGSQRFSEMMEKVSYGGKRPRIILDTPPLKGGADVDILLDGVDGVLLVIRRGHTAMADVMRILRRIPAHKLLGVIFNGNKDANL